MSLAVFFEFLLETLDITTNQFNEDDIRVRLFVNDITPDSETELDDFTECTVTGYAYQPATDWVEDGATYVPPRAVATHPWVTFTCSGAGVQIVYGYMVTRGADTLLWSERFATPQTWGIASGQTLSIQPVYTRRSEFNSGV